MALVPATSRHDLRARPANVPLLGPQAVSAALLAYLEQRLDAPQLSLAEPIEEFTHGWETYTYRFRLMPHSALMSEWKLPMVVRIYASPCGVPQARRAFAIQSFLAERGFPVPKPVLFEENCDLFGGPFFLMHFVEGELLLRRLVARPWTVCSTPWPLASTQLQLHAVPADGFPTSTGGSLSRQHEELLDLIRDHGLAGLRSGHDWLRANLPRELTPPVILHLDYHPANVISTPSRGLFVIDWTEAELGDPHADVATSLMMMDCMPPMRGSSYNHVVASTGKLWFRRWYLRSYHWRSRLDRSKLAYFRAWAALRRLCAYGRWLRAGPAATGSKPTSLGHLSPAHIERLERYFEKWSGVAVHLEC